MNHMHPVSKNKPSVIDYNFFKHCLIIILNILVDIFLRYNDLK